MEILKNIKYTGRLSRLFFTIIHPSRELPVIEVIKIT